MRLVTHHRILATALGELTLVGTGETLTGVYFPGHWTKPDRTAFGSAVPAAFADVERQLAEYLSAARTTFELDVALPDLPFRRAVWDLIAEIPYGETRSYRELAVEIGSHPRAVGTAVAHNPLSIVVPCHRVVGTSGALTGYAGGLERKRALLELEGAAVVSVSSPHAHSSSW